MSDADITPRIAINSHEDSGTLIVRRGTPWRQGVWKHRIADAPAPLFHGTSSAPQAVSRSGQDVHIVDQDQTVDFRTPLVGERGDSFLVTIRLKAEEPHPVGSCTMRTGYRQMWRMLWQTHHTDHCKHPRVKLDTLRVRPGWIARRAFYPQVFEAKEQYRVCRTAGSSARRWIALLSAPTYGGEERQLVRLRGSKCCIQCALNQTETREGTWCLIL